MKAQAKQQKATIIERGSGRAKYEYERKELTSGFNLVGLRKNKALNLMTVKFYMGRSASSSVVYCNVWAGDKDFCTSGAGNAGGGGYHKESAALQAAITSAGIALRNPIDARGDGAMREAIKAIGKALGYRKLHLVAF